MIDRTVRVVAIALYALAAHYALLAARHRFRLVDTNTPHEMHMGQLVWIGTRVVGVAMAVALAVYARLHLAYLLSGIALFLFSFSAILWRINFAIIVVIVLALTITAAAVRRRFTDAILAGVIVATAGIVTLYWFDAASPVGIAGGAAALAGALGIIRNEFQERSFGPVILMSFLALAAFAWLFVITWGVAFFE